MSEWQPIETAPKDGTEIIVWTVHGECELTRYVARTHDSYDEVGDGLYRKRSEECGFWNSNKPTHWMPLPAPPVAANARA